MTRRGASGSRRLAIRCGAILALALPACQGQQDTTDLYVARPVTADELIGTWRTTGDADLGLLNVARGVAPLEFSGKSLTLAGDGTCSVTVGLLSPTSPSPTSMEPVEGRPRHPTDVCLWRVGKTQMDRASSPRQITVINITVTRAGYQRGVVLFVREHEKKLRLWAPVNEPDRRVELAPDG